MSSIIDSNQVAPVTLKISKQLTLEDSHPDFESSGSTWYRWNITQWKWIAKEVKEVYRLIFIQSIHI